MTLIKYILRNLVQIFLLPSKMIYGHYSFYFPSIKKIVQSPTFKQLNAFRTHTNKKEISKWKEIFSDLNYKEGDTIFDIGGNLGYTSLLYNEITSINSRILTFEPYLPNIRFIQNNISKTNIELLTIGLGNENEYVSIGFPDYTQSIKNKDDRNNTGRVSVVNVTKNDMNSFQSSCIIYKLDDLLGLLKIDDIFFIKIDIEGYEGNFLRGANNSILKYRPIIYMEINPKTYNDPSEELSYIVNFFKQHDYKFVSAVKQENISVADINRTDVFFIPSEINILNSKILKEFKFE